MINLPKRPAPRSRFLLVFCVMVLLGLVGAQMFLNRAGAQKQEEKKVQTTTDPSSSVSPAATTKPTDKELKQKLTPEQYYVTQKCGTEPPFNNAYWNNHTPGIYVDVVTGEALFTLETDKVSTEITAEKDGILQTRVAEGAEVKIGDVVATIEEGTASGAKAEKKAEPAAEKAAAKPARKPAARRPRATKTDADTQTDGAAGAGKSDVQGGDAAKDKA